MAGIPLWVLPMAIAVVGSIVVVVAALRTRKGIPQRKRKGPRTKSERKSPGFQFTCTVCQRELTPARDALLPLMSTEMGLAVRAVPDVVGRKLAEYVCPHCEADHCFAVDGKNPEWIGVNLYSPQIKGAVCQDCRKTLRRPPWPPGQFDGRPREATHLDDDYGLICGRCDAVCCVECVQKATRNRTTDGSFLCPRCHRSPIDSFFHS